MNTRQYSSRLPGSYEEALRKKQTRRDKKKEVSDFNENELSKKDKEKRLKRLKEKEKAVNKKLRRNKKDRDRLILRKTKF